MKKTTVTLFAALFLSASAAQAENLRGMTAVPDEADIASGVKTETPGQVVADDIFLIPSPCLYNNTGEYSAISSASSSTYSSGRTNNGSWVFGFGMGASFGDYTSISLAPEIGYNWNGFFTLGAGITYSHYSHDDYDYKLNYLGGNIVGRLYPIRYIHVFVQPEIYRRWGKVQRNYGLGAYSESESKTVSCLLLGGGLTLPAGNLGNVNISVYYDVSQDRYSPHGDRIGFSVGYSFRI